MHPFLRKMNSYICQKHGRTNVLLQAKYGIGIVYNYVRYSATISDYFEGSFYTKTHEEKLEYITSPQALQFAVFVDSMDYVRKYTSKTEMYQALKDYIHRDQLFTVMGNTKTVLCDKNQEEVHNCTISSVCSREQFMSFVKKHPMCIYKPDGNDCGRGIELWTVNETNAEEKYQKAISEPAVLDELVVQAPVMSALNPSSVNTVRLFSLVIDGKCDFFAAFFRMGRNGSIVDNLGSGGLSASIDVNTGKLFTPAMDSVGHCFEKHPDTGATICGFQIPHWDKLLSFTEKAALNYPLHYVGWDIAVCEDGFQIIEANPDPMIHGIQTKFDGGRKKQYEELEKKIGEYRNGIH